jgi:acetyl esterase/lipase
VRSLFLPLLVGTSLFVAPQRAVTQTTLPLWPPSATGTATQQETDTTTAKDDLIAGKRVQRLTGVSHPTITVYPAPPQNNSGAAVVVFPGGGYRILAFDLEGTEVCQWLNAVGVSCVLLKYRVPNAGPYPAHSEDLADAQRAVRLTRQHAVNWKLDLNRIGVLGFSAGGHLAAALSNHADDEVYPPSDAADHLSAQPNFALIIYPGGLVHPPERRQLEPGVIPTAATPPTFLVQAEDDPVHVENTLVYYAALKDVKVPAEMHVFAHGGHGYGLRPTELPVTKWPQLATEWLHTIGMRN